LDRGDWRLPDDAAARDEVPAAVAVRCCEAPLLLESSGCVAAAGALLAALSPATGAA
jgi:hypothetical protein